jgi:hypothetical protein
MRRFIGISLALALGFGAACRDDSIEEGHAEPTEQHLEGLAVEAHEPEAEPEHERIARLYPIEGVVKLFQASIKSRPSRDAAPIGFVRRGVRVRARSVEEGAGCKGSWLELHPEGYVCEGFDVMVGEELPEELRDLRPPRREDAMPYDYYFVTLDDTPVLRRRPSPREREAVLAWLGRLKHFRRNEEKKLERFLAGELDGEPTRPRVVDRLLARGYYVSSPKGLETPGRYVRNAQGEFLFDDTLRKVDPSELMGVSLGAEHRLPLGFLNRPARPLRVIESDETVRFVEDPEEEPLARYTLLPGAKPAALKGDFLVHELTDGRVLKDWFVGVAERIDPPFKVEPDEAWVHVDVGEQTLVLYRGREPVYATLVSTGVDGYDTPEGVFRVEKKFVGRTMNDVSPDTPKGDRYRIEDVPFTQYFQGSYALHAAFWHDRFGTRRSHGCVNLSPHDARVIFEATRPTLHEGWFGTYADPKRGEGTRVYITP